MTLKRGAETIAKQCLDIGSEEHVVVVNDGNDQNLLDALIAVVEDVSASYEYLRYEEPDTHGEEPPLQIAEAMREADVFIAPTKKSLSHTDARREACEADARGATLPGITQSIWSTSLQADYKEIKRITDKVFELLSDAKTIQITTPSGTDLTLEYDIEYFHKDTGLIHRPGEFGNLPAGEADGGILNAEGVLVIDHFPFAPSGTTVEIKDRRVDDISHPEAESSEFAEAMTEVDNARNIAEFGFGTNPAATLIGNVLQDEKVYGTVHIAFGDNSSYLPPEASQYTNCDLHWDSVCESPTVYFDDTLILDNGTPVFRE